MRFSTPNLGGWNNERLLENSNLVGNRLCELSGLGNVLKLSRLKIHMIANTSHLFPKVHLLHPYWSSKGPPIAKHAPEHLRGHGWIDWFRAQAWSSHSVVRSLQGNLRALGCMVGWYRAGLVILFFDMCEDPLKALWKMDGHDICRGSRTPPPSWHDVFPENSKNC